MGLSYAHLSSINGRPVGRKQYYEYIRAQAENEYSSFMPHYQDIADHIMPRRYIFNSDEKSNRGKKMNQKILDSTATLAQRTFRAGMLAGTTSPSRVWSQLAPPDPGMKEFGPVKDYLYTVNRIIHNVFSRTNLYNELGPCFGDLGNFATGAILMEEDFENYLRFYSAPLGTYRIALGADLKVNTFMREIRFNVMQVVQKFGRLKSSGHIDWSNFSDQVRIAWENARYLEEVDVVHMIMPNKDHKPGSFRAKDKKFSSSYYECDHRTMQDGRDVFLRDSGYDFFPALVPRWEVAGEDTYGTDCPGMMALGDIRELQLMKKRKSQAVEYMSRPPLKAPVALENGRTSNLPG